MRRPARCEFHRRRGEELPGLLIARPQGSTYTISKVAWAGVDAPDLTGIFPASFTGAALPQRRNFA